MNEQKKLWVITDSKIGKYTFYTDSNPYEKLNNYLFAKELEADTWYDEKYAEAIKERHNDVCAWFKDKDLNNMSVGSGFFYDQISVNCVEVE